LADSRRIIWDDLEAKGGQTGPVLVEQLQLLTTFFNSRRQGDLVRLTNLSSRISTLGYDVFLSCPEFQSGLVRLAIITLEALKA
jgi:hypothetical protein